ncbi:hypothetical protein NDU88_004409 [Pleurodeles waltl]|uniref:Uncharacterized protein n=1 Tax=Pleurodeles waltl TaxID=8319 RepID=A0AAV7MXE4_PLEWA|nr:hypothetical protein NDU88_004409 [Pleurodeles waltl]
MASKGAPQETEKEEMVKEDEETSTTPLTVTPLGALLVVPQEKEKGGEHGGLRHTGSALGRFRFRFLGGVAKRCCRSNCGGGGHTDVRTAVPQTGGKVESSWGCAVVLCRAGVAPNTERSRAYFPSGE